MDQEAGGSELEPGWCCVISGFSRGNGLYNMGCWGVYTAGNCSLCEHMEGLLVIPIQGACLPGRVWVQKEGHS